MPAFFTFPPFFTLQPVLGTREKQLRLWCDLVLKYHNARKEHSFAWRSWPLWENRQINRRLSDEGALAVAQELIRGGHAEWQDASKTRMVLFFQSPAETASKLYEWVRKQGRIGEVFTVYELHQGDEMEGTDFFGTDEAVFRKALAVLERDGKAELFQGATSEEDGVKFFPPPPPAR
ncbi:unnamed protein product [Phaeothamnion confervicola]